MVSGVEYVDPTTLTIIGFDTEDRDGEHPLFDSRVFLPTDDNLVKNILVYGIQQPVIVRKEAGRTLVVDGRQRVKAAREAAQRQNEGGEFQLKVPTMEVAGDDKRVAGIMISTNEQRTNDEVLEKAFKAVRLLDMGIDIDEVCIAFGRTKTTLKNWISLSKADPKIHAALKEGKIGSSAAIELSKLARDEQVPSLERMIQANDGQRVTESQAKKTRQKATGSNATEPSEAKAASGKKGKKDAEGGDGLPPEVGENGSGDNGVSGSSTTSNRPPPGKKAVQKGIKRSWIRLALKTEAAKKLHDDNIKVLKWFAVGESEKGDWFDDFMWEASAEIGEDARG